MSPRSVLLYENHSLLGRTTSACITEITAVSMACSLTPWVSQIDRVCRQIGEVGAVLCFDASRLALNGRDWHHLLELCGLIQARVTDRANVA